MRPRYHYTAKANWLSDPNGLVHDGAAWHMFYQYNPRGEDWGDMSWGHAVSTDLAHWRELAPALLADDREMIFSGSAVIDAQGSAGLGRGAMVALYTACARGHPPHQAQALAFSRDRGESWARHPGNPLLDIGLADFRDPFVFRHEASQSWIMVVVKSAEQIAQIYRSADLVEWSLASEIPAGNAPGRVWECPALVQLPIAGTAESRWLFKVDALHDAPGAGALYCTGDFDGHRFIPDPGGWQVVDHGRDFYAAIAWNGPRDAAGRPVWIGWMGNHAYQARFPRRGWRGVMSLPRRMGLVEKGDGLRLAQEVEPAVEALFVSPHRLGGARREVPLACRIDIAGDFGGSCEIGDGGESRLIIRAGQEGGWHIEREDTNLPFLAAQATLARAADSGLSVWIDSETIEILSDDGTCSAAFQHRPHGKGLTIMTDQSAAISVAGLR
jgi:sucrose-6-phosphate hydrolase SacC (GH32 family)